MTEEMNWLRSKIRVLSRLVLRSDEFGFTCRFVGGSFCLHLMPYHGRAFREILSSATYIAVGGLHLLWKDADPDIPILIEAEMEYEKLKRFLRE